MLKNVDAKEVASTAFCVSSVDGHKLHEVIFDTLSRDGEVNVSLSHVRRLTTAFLNSALGQLYNEFPFETVDRKVRFLDGTPQFSSLVERVRKRAKIYFSASDEIISEMKKNYPDD